MQGEQDKSHDELLDRATAALQGTPIPSGPPAEVVASTLAALSAAADVQSTQFKKKVFTMRALTKLAAAAVVAMAIAGALLWATGLWGTKPAFADVLQKIREVTSVQYKQTTTVQVPNDPPRSLTSQVLIADTSRMRADDESGTATIMDWKQGKYLMLLPENASRRRIALMGDIKRGLVGAPQINLLERFQKADASTGKTIGQTEIGGRKADGFEFVDDGSTVQVWVDHQTKMPLLVEIKGPQQSSQPAGTMTTFAMTDFVWNPKVDGSRVSLTPPEGYRLEQAPEIDMTEPTIVDLTAGLKAAAELNAGTFPAGIDMAGLQEVIKRLDRLPVTPAQQAAQRAKLQKDGSRMILTIGRMWVFVGDAKNGEDWRYAGEGVALGQAGRPIFWYHPAGAKDYRVIDADLSVRDVPKDKLPNIPSKPLKNPSIMPATKQPK